MAKISSDPKFTHSCTNWGHTCTHVASTCAHGTHTHTLNMSENNQSKCTPKFVVHNILWPCTYIHTHQTAGTHTPEQDHTVQVYVCVCVYWHAHTHTDTEIMVKKSKNVRTHQAYRARVRTRTAAYTWLGNCTYFFKNNCTVVYSTDVQVGRNVFGVV